MSLPVNLDMDVLRSFVAGIELGSFAKAAARLGRSPSAISLQLRKLEDQVGQILVQKQGRGLVLTEAGEIMLGYARRLLELNDAALGALGSPALSGRVRIGLPQDFAETWLPETLGRFARLHPGVRIDAHVDRNATLRSRLEEGDLDLALLWDEEGAERGGTVIGTLPMAWIGPRRGVTPGADRPLPLVLFGSPCIFRHAALSALDAAAIPWRISFSSPGLAGLWAAVSAGLGLTVRTAHGLPASLTALDSADSGLPRLPSLSLRLFRDAAESDPAIERLASLLTEVMGLALDGIDHPPMASPQ
ncbi:LysR substrate-binding domain-containing protein [Methylobacterium sp. E-045]|uniref:LysR substrate-binding domain-containing protein n=1 Tax=Methylobacterium sp. E-045 TaxID=2836575 RepID=UPI001FB9A92B|nr:LysR substrate-binding domain-containing protein [Methylobacterium sp. E-045]MCJ2129722.1 LysR substrate-binding domain-containing protein [Methylobacterium sp. E-045]